MSEKRKLKHALEFREGHVELAVVSEIAEVEEKQPHLTNVGPNDPFVRKRASQVGGKCSFLMLD